MAEQWRYNLRRASVVAQGLEKLDDDDSNFEGTNVVSDHDENEEESADEGATIFVIFAIAKYFRVHICWFVCKEFAAIVDLVYLYAYNVKSG